jgi:hypothetical protein
VPGELVPQLGSNFVIALAAQTIRSGETFQVRDGFDSGEPRTCPDDCSWDSLPTPLTISRRRRGASICPFLALLIHNHSIVPMVAQCFNATADRPSGKRWRTKRAGPTAFGARAETRRLL